LPTPKESRAILKQIIAAGGWQGLALVAIFMGSLPVGIFAAVQSLTHFATAAIKNSKQTTRDKALRELLDVQKEEVDELRRQLRDGEDYIFAVFFVAERLSWSIVDVKDPEMKKDFEAKGAIVSIKTIKDMADGGVIVYVGY